MREPVGSTPSILAMPDALLRSALLALLALPLVTTSACAREAALIGQVSVIDGDTLDMRGQRIRLHGVDAPESAQLCHAPSGRPYRCGAAAANALSDFIARRPVTCDPKDVDRYKRVVGRCSVDGVDLNGWLVRNGWALAYRQYSTSYIADESRARAAKAGIHGGTFIAPWDYRKSKRKQKS